MEGAGQVSLESRGIGTYDVSWPSRAEAANEDQPRRSSSRPPTPPATRWRCRTVSPRPARRRPRSTPPPTSPSSPAPATTGIALKVVGAVPGISAEQFEEAAQAAQGRLPGEPGALGRADHARGAVQGRHHDDEVGLHGGQVGPDRPGTVGGRAGGTVADPGGPIGATKESMATLKNATNPPSREQLLSEVALDIQEMAQRRGDPIKGFKPAGPTPARACSRSCAAWTAIVAAKASAEEVARVRHLARGRGPGCCRCRQGRWLHGVPRRAGLRPRAGDDRLGGRPAVHHLTRDGA